MAFKEVFQALIVEDGGKKRLKIHNSAYFATKLSKIPANKKVWVTVDDRAPKRSDQQNRLYWQYLTYIESETGNDKEDLHEYFAQKYLALPESVLTLKDGTKQMVRGRRSTVDLSKAEFSHYMQRVELESGVPIPDTEAYLYGAKEEQIDVYNAVMKDYPDTYTGAPTI